MLTVSRKCPPSQEGSTARRMPAASQSMLALTPRTWYDGRVERQESSPGETKHKPIAFCDWYTSKPHHSEGGHL